MQSIEPLALLAYVLMFVGLIGSVLPVVPGPIFIWLGALAWAANDGFQAVGWPTLLFLGILTIIAWGSDLAMTALVSRKTGASWKAIAGAIIGGFAGGILLGSWIPIVGTIIATILGAIVGMVGMEYVDKRDMPLALKATQGYLLGMLASTALELVIALLMLFVFGWQAFLQR